MGESKSLIQIEVAYGEPDRQLIKSLKVKAGSDVASAIKACGIMDEFQSLQKKQIKDLTIGIFSKKYQLDHILHDGDRVEIYRPLTVDPKTARRMRADTKRE